MNLKIEYVNIDDLKTYENNAKLHPADQVEQIKKSIQQFGMNDPIAVWKDNVIIEGHGRLIACKELGFTELPVVRLDNLTDEQRRAYTLAHNKLTMNSGFDFDVLADELDSITDIDMSDFGFDLDFDFDDYEQEVIEDEIPDQPTESMTKSGDIWILGNHRLICGDATDDNTISKLMNGEIADITFTSPPYNADHLDVALSEERGGGYNKATQKKYLADDDNRTDAEYFEFLCNNLDLMLKYSTEVFYNIGVGAGSKIAITQILNHYSEQFKDLIYWCKDNPMPVIVESVISSATELIICLGENGSRSFKYFNDRLFHGVIKGHSAALTNEYADIHKATFPVYLPSEIIKRFTPVGGKVIDCFGGTGTTLIACEQLNRKCYMSELDPRYNDVIVERYIKFKESNADVFLIRDGEKIPYSQIDSAFK